LKKLFESFVVVLSLIVFVLFLFVFILDWTGGCGESYVYADGTRHLGECVGREFILSNLGGIFK
jgi:hypothetical protein